MCKAKNKSGKKCQARAMSNGLCSIHQTPGRAAELSQKGVAARREAAEKAAARIEQLAPTSLSDVAKQSALAFVELRTGKTNAATARAHATLGMVLLKAFELLDAQARLPQLVDPNEIDPADLSLEEWERKYHPRLMNTHSQTAVQPASEQPERNAPLSGDRSEQRQATREATSMPRQHQASLKQNQTAEAHIKERPRVKVARIALRRRRRPAEDA
jgi:hypothetical protein